MSENSPKRYYWLKLRNTYFSQLEQKKMRKQENGKDMQIIYLRMMLLSIDKGGYIYYQGVYDSIEEELAEEFFEDVDIVEQTVKYLQENNMLEVNDLDYFLPQAVEYTGSECYSAERVRNFRKKQKKLQCNTHVTQCNEEIEKESEKDKDKEIEKEERDRINYQQIADMYNNTCVSFPRLNKLSDARKKAIKARLNQYNIEDFQRMFNMAESSSFLKGKNDRNWSANFDWMIKDANMAKILDGNYQDNERNERTETLEERYARLEAERLAEPEPSWMKYLNVPDFGGDKQAEDEYYNKLLEEKPEKSITQSILDKMAEEDRMAEEARNE